MKTLWNRITLECYRQSGDDEKITLPRFLRGLLVAAIIIATGWIGNGAGL